jgi:hypothetical protein
MKQGSLGPKLATVLNIIFFKSLDQSKFFLFSLRTVVCGALDGHVVLGHLPKES